MLLAYDGLSSDYAKLLVFALVLVGVFLLVRMTSRRNQKEEGFPPQQFPLGNDDGAFKNLGSRAVDPAMRFEHLVLRAFHMREFDVLAGPPDPFEFVDEITAVVEHLETGERSTWQFTIGTPAGFARLLEGKEWESFYSPGIFVVRKYELELVREMVVDHITETLNPPPDAHPGSRRA